MTTTLTSRQIQGDIYRMLRADEYAALVDIERALLHDAGGEQCTSRDKVNLAAAVNGNVYRSPELRPRDSRAEDIVIIFTTGYADEVQEGVVTINIFVPDIDPFGNGVLVEDVERCEQIERLAQEWVDSLTADKSLYRFSLQRTITTEAEADIRQHFIAIALKYRYYNE